jgi:hypothetical protein
VTPLHLPHTEPIRFAQHIISMEPTSARVKIAFDQTPTLPMLIEAAAQSSAAFSDGSEKAGFLVSLKNIKLLGRLDLLEYEVQISCEHQMDPLAYFNFEIFDAQTMVAQGSLVIAIQK